MSQLVLDRCALPTPGLEWGAYPERRMPSRGKGAGIATAMASKVKRLHSVGHNLDRRSRLALTKRLRSEFRELSTAEIEANRTAIRLLLRRDGLTGKLAASALAHAALACERVFGLELHESQLCAALVVLDNRLAEMATGEGKTLAVAAAAAVAALAGIPVHVITANDYLVARDATTQEPLFTELGLTVGHVTQPMDPAQRREAYAQDITYATAKELVFDYLRDGTNRERDALRWRIGRVTGAGDAVPVLRGLCMAIVDEADSILIDEARVPFVLSKAGDDPQQHDYLSQALDIARALRSGEDYAIDRVARQVRLSPSGRSALDKCVESLGPLWHNRLHRDETVCMALSALHLYARDRDYIVRDGKPLIVDETTGRIAPGRAWSRGLQQLIELKEGCAASAPLVTAAQITYQRFFPRYLRLAGVSGTLEEAGAELRAIYGLGVSRIALNRPSRRRILAPRLFPNDLTLWDAVVARAAELRAQGRPVLIGADSVASAHTLSEHLRAAGVPHALLSARQDAAEAAIVAQAGNAGQITVATNMAGRGTDIPLGDGVAARGGLHVINCQLNAARRIDRQLAGRCARQGDPGSVETWMSLEMPLLRKFRAKALLGALPGRFALAAARSEQRAAERRDTLLRSRLVEHDKRVERQLSFGSSIE